MDKTTPAFPEPAQNSQANARNTRLWLVILAAFLATPPLGRALQPEPLEPDDGSGHLVRGALAPATLDANKPQELTFTADGQGLVTLCWTLPNKAVKLELIGIDGKPINLKPFTRQVETDGRLVRHAALPVDQAGDFKVRLTAKRQTQLRIGSAWMPFHKLKPSDIKANNITPIAPQGIQLADEPEHWLEGMPTLPIGSIVQRKSPAGRPHAFHFKSKHPGILTVAIHSDTSDQSIQIKDDKGRPLPDGYSDTNNEPGLEHLSVAIREPGHYEVIVSSFDGGAGGYRISGSWLTAKAINPKQEGQADQ